MFFSSILYSEEFTLVAVVVLSFKIVEKYKWVLTNSCFIIWWRFWWNIRPSFFKPCLNYFWNHVPSVPIILKKHVANLSSKQLKNHEIYIFASIPNHRKYKEHPPLVILHFWSYLLPRSNFTLCLINSFMWVHLTHVFPEKYLSGMTKRSKSLWLGP